MLWPRVGEIPTQTELNRSYSIAGPAQISSTAAAPHILALQESADWRTGRLKNGNSSLRKNSQWRTEH